MARRHRGAEEREASTLDDTRALGGKLVLELVANCLQQRRVVEAGFFHGFLQPFSRFARADDLARMSRDFQRLASGEVPYATGAVIVVDGGLTLPRL